MVLKKVKLKEVLETNISGEWGKDPVEGSQTSINIIRTTNFSNDGRIDFSNIIKREVDLKKIEQKKLKYGDIIIEKSGGSPTQPVGRVIFFNLSSEDIYLCNNFTAILRCNSKVFPKYLLYYLLNAYKRNKTLNFQNKTTGIINLQLSRYIKELEIPLPPIEIQIKIAEALDKAQELIDNRKLQLEKYDELIQSTFMDMFGDPVTNPKKWEIKEIKKLIEGKISNGFFASNDNYEDKGTQIIWISDFINKFYSNITQLKRVVISEKDLEKNLVEYGDAIFCRSSLTKEGIGKCAIIPEFLEEKIIYECHIIKIKLNMKIIIPEFFRAYSDLTYFRNQIMKYSKTSTMTTISQEGILKGLVYLPPLEKQLKFKNIVTKIFEKKKLCEESLKQMEENFNSIIDKAFKGELF